MHSFSVAYSILLILSVRVIVSAASWNLVWSDEFNVDGQVDTTRWHFETGTGTNGWGNNELELYTNRPENAYVRNGNLEISVRKQDTAGMHFTSARLTTGYGKFSFQYGKVEARIKTVKGKGMWPAFWMLGEAIAKTPWPGCGEIDIMEMMNRGGTLDDHIVLATAHWLYDANNTHAQYGLSDTCPTPLAESFHVYTVTWDKRYIRAFFDGRQYWEIDITPSDLTEFHLPFYLLLNVAVGGNGVGITNPTEISAPLPQTMQVDYVRIYQEASTAARTVERIPGQATNVVLRFLGRSIVSVPVDMEGLGSQPTLTITALNGKEVLRCKLTGEKKIKYADLTGDLTSGIYCATIRGGSRARNFRFLRIFAY